MKNSSAQLETMSSRIIMQVAAIRSKATGVTSGSMVRKIYRLKDELYSEQNLKLFFPNPVTNELHFECPFLNATHWRVTSMNGELLYEWKFAEQDNNVFIGKDVIRRL
jgi:hypothetical protein